MNPRPRLLNYINIQLKNIISVQVGACTQRLVPEIWGFQLLIALDTFSFQIKNHTETRACTENVEPFTLLYFRKIFSEIIEDFNNAGRVN